jgi:hypothetical protein
MRTSGHVAHVRTPDPRVASPLRVPRCCTPKREVGFPEQLLTRISHCAVRPCVFGNAKEEVAKELAHRVGFDGRAAAQTSHMFLRRSGGRGGAGRAAQCRGANRASAIAPSGSLCYRLRACLWYTVGSDRQPRDIRFFFPSAVCCRFRSVIGWALNTNTWTLVACFIDHSL